MNKRITIILSGLLFFVLSASADTGPVYLDRNADLEERVEDALARMTLEEKIAMLHAQSKFSSAGVPRLGIPHNWTTDGPHGIRTEPMWDEWGSAGWTIDSCTAFPALTCLAATWNEDMAALYGKSIGEEARYRNKNILLGPGVNINRTPLNGRNFEYMGEDPYLASKMVVPYVREVQKNGVAACVKHFALNNQERQRWDINVVVDDRALYEIYLPAFKAAVHEGGAWAIMGSYNKYKGQHCSHNQYLLDDILKKEWDFDGVVISDWGGTHDTMEAVKNGLDMEFGTWTDGLGAGASDAYANYFLSMPYYDLIKSGKVGTVELDDKVRRILRLVFRTTMSDNMKTGSFASPEHEQAAKVIAEEGTVLLKNDKSILPLHPDKIRNILVLGDNAVRKMTVGGGSSGLKVKYEVSPLAGLQKRVPEDVKVTYLPAYAVGVDSLKAATLANEAVEAAKSADMVIFVGGLNKENHQDCEGDDRRSYNMSYGQDDIISRLAAVNKNLAVVIVSGNAVAMPWIDQVPAVIQAWYSGSESGSALASIIFGDVSPSGKLPFSIFKTLEDCSAHAFGKDGYPGNGKDVFYHDGIMTGYRWLDYKDIEPLFSFGHGLTYTEFRYGKAAVNKKTIASGESLEISVKVKNIGKVAAKEVVQLYISDMECSVLRPEKELKGFDKISLAPGEEKTVTFTVSEKDLSFYQPELKKWVAEPGKFKALVAASSADIRAEVDFEFK